MAPELIMHHTGCVVENIEQSLEIYKQTLGFHKISEVYHIVSQNVKVCFIEVGYGVYLELVEPSASDTPVSKLLKKRHSYYHIGYKTKQFDLAVKHFNANGTIMVTSFNSEAFNNKRCAFFYTKELHMIEIIES